MSETTNAKVDSIRQEIGDLRTRMNEFSRAVEMQRRALRQLQMAVGSVPQAQRVVQNATNASNFVSNAAQQIASRLPLFENALNRLRADIDAMEKEHAQLRALSEVGAVINSTLDPDEVLNRVMDKIIQITGAERGYLMLRNEETSELEFKVARNMDQETLNKQSFQVSRTIVTTVAETGEAVVTTNAQADPRFQSQESVIGYSLRSILCVPLRVKGSTIGVVYADNRIRSGLFGERERDVLTAFANQAAVAIDNARLFESVANQKKLMDDILRSITSGVITTDVADKITLFNRAAENILSAQTELCVGQSFEVLGPLQAVLPKMVQRVKETDAVIQDYEAEPQIAGRGKVSLTVNLAPLKDANEETQGVAIVVNDVTERKQFERERSMVKRYLPTELVDSLADLQELQLGGTRETVSILFGDIRGFTTYSESHAPEQVVDMINHYYNIAARVIRENDGIVDKYEGDCVMAHFGTPLHPIQDHAWKAVKTACEIQQVIDEDHSAMPPEDRLHFGIGINTGEAVAGNVGGEEQMDYTLIGDAVNLSKRLQENAPPGVILLGDSTYQLVKAHVEVETLEPLQVKGRTAYEQVYKVTNIIG
ncbi:MAG: GAF domain-containing protein [Anaerolineae bacterium]|nr:GAF domain-containing protein [Anaerolineae bacterium]